LQEIAGWFWNYDDMWNNSYLELVQWINAGKDKILPSASSNDKIEKKLGSFCKTQQFMKKNNRLDDNRIKQLDLIEAWKWSEKIILIQSWEESFIELKEWIDCNINKKIPRAKSTNKVEKRLGIFCSRQRIIKKNNNLDVNKIKQLESIENWYWIDDTNNKKSWEENYTELKYWVEHNTNNKLPSAGSNNNLEKRLGIFCNTQKANKKNNKLDDYKINQLELIKNWYWTINEKPNYKKILT
jgi:hypothetical protein